MASTVLKTLAPRGGVVNKTQHLWNATRSKATAASPLQEATFTYPYVLDMPPCDFQPQPYKGPSYDEVRHLRRTHLSSGQITFYKEPLLIDQGHMQWLFDHTGRRYLDLFAGIVTVSVGHCHPKINRALKDQLDRLWHTTNIYMHPRIHEFSQQLTAKLPGDLKVCYFVNSGAEANEVALMMARLYTGRYDILSLRNAYHGTSPSLQALTALSTWRMPVPAGFGIQQTMNPDVYRGPWGGAYCRDSPIQTDRQCDCVAGQCKACDMYIDQLKDVLNHSTPKQGVAGFWAEPIQGVGGTAQYPKDYLRRAYGLVRESGGLCISDEVQTGFGRLGSHFWGFETHGVMPDIVTMAKGIGNGFPMAAVVTTKEIADTIGKALHFNTYGGNPMACAVGSAVLETIEEDKCQERSEVVGTYLMHKLATLRDEFEIVGDVRGKGLMVGLEFVKDKATREPLPAAEVNSIWEATREMGLLVGKGGLYGTCLRIKPPMCITKDDVDFAVSVLRRAIYDHVNGNGN